MGTRTTLGTMKSNHDKREGVRMAAVETLTLLEKELRNLSSAE